MTAEFHVLRMVDDLLVAQAVMEPMPDGLVPIPPGNLEGLRDAYMALPDDLRASVKVSK